LLLGATPLQMGLLGACETAPFVLFSLPVGVWLDRVRKLPVYIAGELVIAFALLTVPLMWSLGWLTMGYLYGVAFALGCVFVAGGAAAQIVLTQVVPRSRLIEAHAKNALAGSAAEVAGPGAAGMLIKLAGAPFALLADACLLLLSVMILRGVKVEEVREVNPNRHFGRDLMAQPLAAHPGPHCRLVAGVAPRGNRGANSVCRQKLGANRATNWFEFYWRWLGYLVGWLVWQPFVCAHRPWAMPGDGCVDQRAWLAGIGNGPNWRLGHGGLCANAVVVGRRRSADLHQLFGAAPGGYARTFAWPNDQHHALADHDPCSAGCLDWRLFG
jgi:hypothetical protein